MISVSNYMVTNILNFYKFSITAMCLIVRTDLITIYFILFLIYIIALYYTGIMFYIIKGGSGVPFPLLFVVVAPSCDLSVLV